MKVVLDCRSVHPGMGGIGRATAALARHLPVALAPTDELVLLRDASVQTSAIVTGAQVTDAPVDARMIDPVFEQFTLPALLDELAADLVHGTCFMTPIAAHRVARVATVHDVVFRRHPEVVDPPLASYLDRWSRVSCAVADAVVTVSDFSRREIAQVYRRVEAAIDVVPNAVDDAFHAIVRRPPQGRPFVLYVGALEAKKNVAALLRAFDELLRLRPELPHALVLAGGRGGQAFDVAQALAALGPARDRVHVVGHVPDDALLDLYARADLFAYLSRYEGFGLPALEAMAAGVPTIVSDRASLPEVVGDGALRVDPDDAPAVARAMLELLTAPDQARALVERGRVRARAFSWPAAATRLVEVYRQALARRDARLAPAPPSPTRLRVLAGRGA
jgi:glycosyltransferase involved in cell wall biosynthesis